MKRIKSYLLFESDDIPSSQHGPVKSETGKDTVVKYFNKNDIVILNDDEWCIVGIDKKIINMSITYYIILKGVDSSNPCAGLKLVYSLRKRYEESLVEIYDNYFKRLEFNQLEILLNKNGLDFSRFNHAWYYIEDNFNNKNH